MRYLRALCAGVFAFALAADASAQTLTANLNGGEETPILNTGAVGTAEVIVAKHRNGPTGMTRLAFLDNLTKFHNMARD